MASACRVRAATYTIGPLVDVDSSPLMPGCCCLWINLPRASLQGATFGLPRLIAARSGGCGIPRGSVVLLRVLTPARRNSLTPVCVAELSSAHTCPGPEPNAQY